MERQSSNASEVPDEITCNQDQQFVEEFTSVNDHYFAMPNQQFGPLLTSSEDDSDETSDGHDDCTGTVCDIPLEHRSVNVDENDFVEGFRNKTCQCSKLYGL